MKVKHISKINIDDKWALGFALTNNDFVIALFVWILFVWERKTQGASE